MLGTLECVNIRLHGRCSGVVFTRKALLELILGMAKLCLTPLLILVHPLKALRARSSA